MHASCHNIDQKFHRIDPLARYRVTVSKQMECQPQPLGKEVERSWRSVLRHFLNDQIWVRNLRVHTLRKKSNGCGPKQAHNCRSFLEKVHVTPRRADFWFIWARIFKLLRSPRIDSQGTNSARLCSLAGRYHNPIPTRFLAPVDCLKIPALL